MLNADFPLYTKQCLKKEVNRIKEKMKEEKGNGFRSKTKSPSKK